MGGVRPPRISETHRPAPAPAVMPGAALPAVLLPLLGLAAGAVVGELPPCRPPPRAQSPPSPRPGGTLHALHPLPAPGRPYVPGALTPCSPVGPGSSPIPLPVRGGFQESSRGGGRRASQSTFSPPRCPSLSAAPTQRWGPPERGLMDRRAEGRRVHDENSFSAAWG